jgi:hypothetical protein
MAEEEGQDRVDARAGLGAMPRQLRGVNREDDPGSIPPDQHYDLVNVRSINGHWHVRGGQSKAHVAALSGEIFGIFDEESSLVDLA